MICLMTISIAILEALKIGHHPAKFGDHRHCSSGYIMVLVCHLI